MPTKSLTQTEIATLVALYEETGASPHAHVPRQAVQAHFRKDLRGHVRKALRKLVRKGYALEHPTRGQPTYGITNKGIQELKEKGLLVY